MALTANDIISRVQERYPDMSSTLGLRYLNERIDPIVQFYLGWRRRERLISLVEGTREYSLPEDTMKVVYAWLMTGGQDGDKRTMRSTSLMELEFSGGWRSVNGNPTQFYTEGSDNDEVIGFYPNPNLESLDVTGATNATPIVITTATHGLSTGDYVFIEGVTGNTAANGFWTITYVSATQFSLDTSVGNGAYVSGGVVACAGFATVLLQESYSDTFTGTEEIPGGPMLPEVYKKGLEWCYAEDHDPANSEAKRAMFFRSLEEGAYRKQGRTAGNMPSLGNGVVQVSNPWRK